MSLLQGTPSDDAEAVLATGRTDVSTVFYSMSARHPEGRDAEYLAWHTLDHRPEQYRLASLRGSLRLVSTPACRAARAASDARYDGVDHVMTYLFADLEGLEPFAALGAALGGAGRMPYVLPPVERGVFRLDGSARQPARQGRRRRPAVVPGARRLPDRRARRRSFSHLAEVPGVAGVWWGSAVPLDAPYATADNAGLQYRVLLPRRRSAWSPPPGCVPSSRRGGPTPSSPRSSPRRSTCSCRTSGSATSLISWGRRWTAYRIVTRRGRCGIGSPGRSRPVWR